MPFSRVFGVASFYSQFRLTPVGKYVIDVCMGTACHVAGAPLVVEAFSQELEIPVGATTADGLFTLQTVNCVGACALAPVGAHRRRRHRRARGSQRGPQARPQASQAGGAGMTPRRHSHHQDQEGARQGRQHRGLPGRRRQDRDPRVRRHGLPRLGPRGPAPGHREGARRARPDRHGRRGRDRLSRLLRGGPHRGGPPAGRLLPAPQAQGRHRDHRDQRGRRRCRRAPAVPRPAERRTHRHEKRTSRSTRCSAASCSA